MSNKNSNYIRASTQLFSGSRSETIKLRDDNFKYKVRDSNKSWLVAFVDPNSGIKSEWDQAAVKLNGKVEMGKVLSRF